MNDILGKRNTSTFLGILYVDEDEDTGERSALGIARIPAVQQIHRYGPRLLTVEAAWMLNFTCILSLSLECDWQEKS